jgi:CheY-like chemotaxis protein
MTGLLVLGVEDQLIPQRVLTAVMQMLGNEVQCVTTGEEALQLVCGQQDDEENSGEEGQGREDKVRYDAIFMDIGLAGDLDGYQTTTAIRNFEESQGLDKDQRTPIFMLTAHGSEASKSRALAAGVDDFSTKPLTLDSAKQLFEKFAHQNPGFRLNI